MITFKEKCRVFYIVKGHLTGVDKETIEQSYDSYFKRLWYNEEAYISQKGFEKEFKRFNEAR